MKSQLTPQMKVPPFVKDAVAELRERRLLPVAVGLLVAILAVPFLLSGGKSSPPAGTGSPVAGLVPSGSGSDFSVVADQGGTRNYRSRLGRSGNRSPFKQLYSSVAAGASTTGSGLVPPGGSAGSGALAKPSSGSAPSGRGAAPSAPSHPASGGSSTTKTRYVSYTVNVKAGQPGSLQAVNGVQMLGPVPTNNPRVMFIGVSQNASKALFLVSNSVASLSGEGVCTLGSGSACQVVALKVGQSETLLPGPYVVQLVKINQVLSSQPSGG